MSIPDISWRIIAYTLEHLQYQAAEQILEVCKLIQVVFKRNDVISHPSGYVVPSRFRRQITPLLIDPVIEGGGRGRFSRQGSFDYRP